MRTLSKPQQRHFQLSNFHQPKKSPSETPGPGSYDISLPFIQPAYEAIAKSDDIMILKVNQHCDSSNFRSGLDRFRDDREKSPGPAAYDSQRMKKQLEQKKKANSQKKHSHRYSDLIDFMYQNRVRISPIPDYQVEYPEKQKANLREIKNSLKRHRQLAKQTRPTHNSMSKSRQISTKSIISFKSSARLAEDIQSATKPHTHRQSLLSHTIDYPQQSKQFKNSKRDLEAEEKQLIHRKTLYNRNMLGILMSQNRKGGLRGSKNQMNISISDSEMIQ